MNAAPSPPTAPASPDLSRDQLVASSSGWVAVSLNLGCYGAGYIYQRRWGAFWIGGLACLALSTLLGLGLSRQVSNLPMDLRPQGQENNPELLAAGAFISGASLGLLVVGVGSAIEAGMAVGRARRRLGH